MATYTSPSGKTYSDSEVEKVGGTNYVKGTSIAVSPSGGGGGSGSGGGNSKSGGGSGSGSGGGSKPNVSTGGLNAPSGIGYAYVDKYGYSHVVDDYEHALNASADGKVYEYTGKHYGGYAYDNDGYRVPLGIEGSKPYGNDVARGRGYSSVPTGGSYKPLLGNGKSISTSFNGVLGNLASKPLVAKALLKSGSVVTPVTPGNQNQQDKLGLREYLNQMGLQEGKDWTYNAGSNTITVNGVTYNANSFPGATLDPYTGLNYISDSTKAGLALRGSDAGITSSVGSGKGSDLESLIFELLQGSQTSDDQNYLQSLLGGEPELAQGIGYNEGLRRATESLGPTYELSLKDVLNQLANSQISRGFYGQLPGDVVTQDATARLEAEKNAAIASAANDLVNQSATQAYQSNSLNSQIYNGRLQAALEMMSQQQQEETSRIANLLSLLSTQNSQYNADRTYGLGEKELQATIQSQAVDEAMNRFLSTGILSAEDAKILNLEPGTKSLDYLYKMGSLAKSGGSTGRSTGDKEGTDSSMGTEAAMLIESQLAAGEITAEQAAAQLDILYYYGQIDEITWKRAKNRILPAAQVSGVSSTKNGGESYGGRSSGSILSSLISTLRNNMSSNATGI